MPTEFESRFPEIIAALPELIDVAVKAGAGVVEEAAKERVPVATGRLRDAIHTERVRSGEYAVVGGNANEAWYGSLVEHGAVYTPPHPFLVPALEDHRHVVIELVNGALHRL